MNLDDLPAIAANRTVTAVGRPTGEGRTQAVTELTALGHLQTLRRQPTYAHSGGSYALEVLPGKNLVLVKYTHSCVRHHQQDSSAVPLRHRHPEMKD
jgi:hypothetical protein